MEHGPAEGIDDRQAKDRFSSEEKKALDRMHQDIYQEIRHAAEAHRQVSLVNDHGFYFSFVMLILVRNMFLSSSLSTVGKYTDRTVKHVYKIFVILN